VPSSRSPLFSVRVALAATRYANRRNPDFGWGAFELSESSIVNTAEVLAILRTAGHACTEDVVADAITFLCAAVEEHPKPRDEGGRGPFARYSTFGLLGLTEFLAALQRADVRRAIGVCQEWLLAHRLPNGGWAEHVDDDRLSAFQTATAIIGLCRLDPRDSLVDEAVGALLELRRGVAFPVNDRERDPSVPHTALATIALYVAGRDNDALAAARWLMRHPARWVHEVDEDNNVPGSPWRHMTFALVLRALVVTGAAQPTDSLLRPTITLLDALWSTSANEWLDGDLRHKTTSVRGSYAAVLAQRALARAAGTAAVDDLSALAEPAEGAQLELPGRTDRMPRLTIIDKTRIALRFGDGSSVTVPLTRAQREVVDALRNAPDGERIEQLAATVGIKVDSMRTRCDRLNAHLRASAKLERFVTISQGLVHLQVALVDNLNPPQPAPVG
jgi:hypothetical protein